MKGKINELENLEIERAGKMKEQLCPYQPETKDVFPSPCGDWCPMFCEPEPYHDDIKACEVTVIRICNDVLSFDDLTDERGQS